MAVIPWFNGTFEGDGHVISNLHMQGSRFLGLFGQTGSGARISNLGLEAVDVNGTTGDHIGSLVGSNEGSISMSYSSGTASGRWRVGGLVGWNHKGSITMSYSTGSVSGYHSIGGLVGDNSYEKGIITMSYSTGAVTGNVCVGGLVGDNLGSITTSYSTGSVNGDSSVGGLVGFNHSDITMSYSTGAVIGNYDVGGGLVGDNDHGSITMSIWDMETSGLTVSDGGVGLTTAEMMDPYMLGLNGFANDPNWILDADRDYPRLAWEGTAGQIIPEPSIDWLEGEGTQEVPYRIDTADQLILLGRASTLWGKHFILGADIDLDPNLQGRQVFSQAVIQVFSGVFDGNGHTISHLTIRGGSHLGLFGQTGSGARISDLGLEAVDVNGTRHVGGLVGNNRGGSITMSYSTGSIIGNHTVGGFVGRSIDGSISNSYSTVSVSGDFSVGGLVGSNNSDITTCYSTGTVTGGGYVGGLVGRNYGTITSCYSLGAVTGNNDVGGLVGYNWGSITSSFWDVETSGLSSSDGGIGKTTAEMQTAPTFLEAGWDFVDETANGTEDIWWIDEGRDYPRLWWEAAEQ
jgi:hypothetical protein